jgi:hypothetical protein
MLLIDTYNVLLVAGVLPPHLAGLDVPGLVELLLSSRYARRQAVLVCDGTPPREPEPAPRTAPGIAVRYAGPERSADDVIRAILDASSAPRAVLLVSSDRELRRAARRRRARSVPSPEFLRELVHDEARGGRRHVVRPMPPVPLDRPALARWMEEFGYRFDPEHRGSVPPGHPTRRKNPLGDRSPTPRPQPPPGPDALRPQTLPPDPSTLDPLLREAIEVWPDRVRLSDLDMSRWIEHPFNPEHDKPEDGGQGRDRRR